MTLLLGIAAPWGMWQSSDHRLTESPGGRLITDSSYKHLGIRTPDGRALLTYTGFGRIDGEHVSDWLRKTLRGENRGLEDTAQYIADRATARMGDAGLKLNLLHTFLLSAFLGDQPYVVFVANTDTPVGAQAKLRREFIVTPIRVTKPVPVLGGGGVNAVSAEDRTLLRQVSGRRPRRPDDYLKLLGEANHRAATSGTPGAATVSRGCLASYLPADESKGINSTMFGDTLEDAKHRTAPYLSFGVDMTEMVDAMPRFDKETGEFTGWHDQEAAARRSVEPE